MKKKLYISIFALIILSILMGILSQYYTLSSVLVGTLLLIMMIKFLIVTFYFMEIKNAHKLWKVLVSVFAIVFYAIIFLIKIA